jgi:hypothetical protein
VLNQRQGERRRREREWRRERQREQIAGEAGSLREEEQKFQSCTTKFWQIFSSKSPTSKFFKDEQTKYTEKVRKKKKEKT